MEVRVQRSRRGLTLLEVVCVAVIIVTVTAILTPVFTGMLRTSKEASAAWKLRQLWAATMQYRSEYGGDGVYGRASDMGLLNELSFYVDEKYMLYSKDKSLWEPACGAHPQVEMARLKIDYFASNYEDPSYPWIEYIQRYQDDALLYRDRNCTSPSIPLEADFYLKTLIAVRFSGQIGKKRAYGDSHSFKPWHGEEVD